MKSMRELSLPYLLIAVLLTGACGTSRDQPFEKGKRFLASGQYSEAEINFKKAIQQNPSLGEAYYQLGLAQSRQAHVRDAYNTLERAIELLPGRDDVAVARADTALAMYVHVSPNVRYYDSVVTTAARLLKADPKSFDGLRLDGFIAMIDKHYPEAIELLSSADAVKPMRADVVQALVQCLIQSGRIADGEKLGLDLIQKESGFAPIYDTLYGYYMGNNRAADGEAILKKKITHNPDVIDYRLQLAAHYLQVKNEPGFDRVVQELTSDPKRFPDARMRVGDLYMSLNRLDDALAQFQAGANESSGRKLAYRKRVAQILMVEGKNDLARNVLEEILKGQSDDYDARNMRAIIDIETADPEKINAGLSELKALSVQNPRDAVLHYNLGRAELRQGDVDAALAQFVESMRLDPLLLESRYLAANVSLRKGDYKGAGEYADDILRVKAAMIR